VKADKHFIKMKKKKRKIGRSACPMSLRKCKFQTLSDYLDELSMEEILQTQLRIGG